MTGTLIRARVSLLSAKDGGRDHPIRGSYRPNHNFFGSDNIEMAVGLIELPEGELLAPGGSAEFQITIYAWDRVDRELIPGRTWRIQEGHKLVGFGEVLEVLEREPL